MPADLRKRPRMPCLAVCGAALLTLVSLTGCAGRGSVENSAVDDAAGRFISAASTEPAKACDTLAPATLDSIASDDEECATAIADLGVETLRADGPELRAQVYGRDAIVQWEDQTMFLARFDSGWLVTAAGCTPRGKDLPYDCSIEGR
ncbi:hypothetical protein ACOCJ7_12650 [Knoellia sp. CPCC 206453]|uniref:hypothetical protein n=1 Tax=Knoellia pratensis TaxID=3404796 RepID=UPI00361EB765